MMAGRNESYEREMPEVDERAVTKYGSQRLVNNGALRRCSTSSTTTTSTLTRSRFTNTLKTLESSNSGSWQWNHWHSFANIHRRSFRTHRLSTSICHTSIVSKRRRRKRERSSNEKKRKKEREKEVNRKCHISRHLFSRDCFFVLFDSTHVILSRSNNDTGDGSDIVRG